MPSSTNVNNLTVVHKDSSGIAMSFPDVCKTPAPPAPPIPIPYPNIAQSADTGDGSSTVKIDGQPIMLKSSSFSKSSGDEAGSLFGLVSSKNKGKAYPANASFDVTADGTAVFRLSDPMQTNGASPTNALNAALMQPPKVVVGSMSQPCKDVRKKKDKKGQNKASENGGMLSAHFSAIKKIAESEQIVFMFRKSNPDCKPWIAAKHQPKPTSAKAGTTIKAKNYETVQAWLDQHRKDPKYVGVPPYAMSLAASYAGIVGLPSGQPQRADTKIKQDSGFGKATRYAGKWITGDYDLYEVLYSKEPGCKQVDQKSHAFSKLKKLINNTLDWDAIQHGPHLQFEYAGIPKLKKKILKGKKPIDAAADIGEGRSLPVIEAGVSVIAPAGTVYLEKPEDTVNALLCSECQD
jgi:hypothetical protein